MRTIELDRDAARALVLGDNEAGVVTSPPSADPPWLVGEHVRIEARLYRITDVRPALLVVERLDVPHR